MLITGKNDAGQRIDRFISKAMPSLSLSRIQKGIRTKNIKLNGKRCNPDDRLAFGDEVAVYVLAPADESLQKKPERDLPAPDVVFQDSNIIIANKPSGLLCQPEPGNSSQDSLEGRIRAYLLSRGEWRPDRENGFAPSLCHRIDRNTRGLVLAAKNAEALRILTRKMQTREIAKQYLCVVHGHPSPAEGTLEDQLFKDSKRNLVLVKGGREKGSRTAITQYRTLDIEGELSLLECTLITGRTHQIRVQMAHRGWPLLGDGKYGSQSLDRPYGRKGQALCAYKLSFQFQSPAGTMQYLSGRSFKLNISFSDLLLR